MTENKELRILITYTIYSSRMTLCAEEDFHRLSRLSTNHKSKLSPPSSQEPIKNHTKSTTQIQIGVLRYIPEEIKRFLKIIAKFYK